MPWLSGKKRGSFKNLLLGDSQRMEEARSLRGELVALDHQWRLGKASDSETAVSLALLYLKSRFGKRAFLSTGTPIPPEFPRNPFLLAVRFFGIPDTIRLSLLKWCSGEWDLRLTNNDVSSLEMLEAQSCGYRFVSFPWELALSGALNEEGRDAIEHFFHDLAHGFMFFRDEYEPQGQIHFFQKMKLDLPLYLPFWEQNHNFRKKMEYCISDMNSHPAHLEAYWKAVCKEAGILP